jgi:DNA-binding response OmpR family regulator
MNVLIIEDEPDYAALTAAVVRHLGGRPQVAPNGETGLALALRQPPEIVLLDLMLPDLDGFEVCRRLRADARTADVPVVMVTALDDSVYRRRGFRVGANAYLTKPCSADDLAEAIASARAWRDDLRRSRVQHEVQLELDSVSGFLIEVDEFLATLCRPTPLDPDRVRRLRQAFLEIGQNAIEWGNGHRPDVPVHVTFRAFDDRVEVLVRDQGPGFDPDDLPHAAQPENPLAHLDARERLGLREGGFGLLIARGLVDELRTDRRGNEVTLMMRFDPGDDAPTDR